jgi:hypothetical protein
VWFEGWYLHDRSNRERESAQDGVLVFLGAVFEGRGRCLFGPGVICESTSGRSHGGGLLGCQWHERGGFEIQPGLFVKQDPGVMWLQWLAD